MGEGLIRGIASDTLLADLLAKAGTLKSIEQKVYHPEVFESALRDQTSMASIKGMFISVPLPTTTIAVLKQAAKLT